MPRSVPTFRRVAACSASKMSSGFASSRSSVKSFLPGLRLAPRPIVDGQLHADAAAPACSASARFDRVVPNSNALLSRACSLRRLNDLYDESKKTDTRDGSPQNSRTTGGSSDARHKQLHSFACTSAFNQ